MDLFRYYFFRLDSFRWDMFFFMTYSRFIRCIKHPGTPVPDLLPPSAVLPCCASQCQSQTLTHCLAIGCISS